MSAYDLKKLSGIYRRDPNIHPSQDLGIQRRHIPERSEEILRYIRDGFPLSRISRRTLVDPKEANSLRMPGWLPTAIVANILERGDVRGPKEASVPAKDLVQVKREKESAVASIIVPDQCLQNSWRPVVHPIEIIDGQHRLWALEEPEEQDEPLLDRAFWHEVRKVQVPVVAFHGLDRTWQAYLFYTINQLPKKVDASLVFDLYPLLRDQEWLERFEGPEVYRQSRAQDLTIILWSHPASPWFDRIVRLGGREKGKVTQASFIRSLIASFIKTYDSPRGPGGLFGSWRGTHELGLPWTREQQAAFLIMIWQQLREAVKHTTAQWATELKKRARATGDSGDEEIVLSPFQGPDTPLAADQGCRAAQFIMNDMFWRAQEKEEIHLEEFQWERSAKHRTDEAAVSAALETLNTQITDAVKLAKSVATSLSTFDWRSSSAVSTGDRNYERQATYRGSGGYKALRENALRHLVENGTSRAIKVAAEDLLELLGYQQRGAE